MVFDFETSGDTGILTLKGDLTIERVKELKDALVACKAEASRVSVRLDAVESVDLSCLQVFCAAHRTFEFENKVLSICAEGMNTLQLSAQRAGFSKERMCDLTSAATCLWGGEK